MEEEEQGGRAGGPQRLMPAGSVKGVGGALGGESLRLPHRLEKVPLGVGEPQSRNCPRRGQSWLSQKAQI